jgi:hypothetical protein
MTSWPPAFPFALLQAAAMCIALLLAGFSFALSLHAAPSLFAVATIEQYYRRTRGLDVLWLIGASVWTGIACSLSRPYWHTSGTAVALSVLAVLVCLGTAGFQRWARRVYTRALGHIMAPVRAHASHSRLVTVTAEDALSPVLQDSVPPSALATVPVALGGYGVLLAGATGLFGGGAAGGLAASWESVLEGLFVLALYVALAVVGGTSCMMCGLARLQGRRCSVDLCTTCISSSNGATG